MDQNFTNGTTVMPSNSLTSVDLDLQRLLRDLLPPPPPPSPSPLDDLRKSLLVPTPQDMITISAYERSLSTYPSQIPAAPPDWPTNSLQASGPPGYDPTRPLIPRIQHQPSNPASNPSPLKRRASEPTTDDPPRKKPRATPLPAPQQPATPRLTAQPPSLKCRAAELDLEQPPSKKPRAIPPSASQQPTRPPPSPSPPSRKRPASETPPSKRPPKIPRNPPSPKKIRQTPQTPDDLVNAPLDRAVQNWAFEPVPLVQRTPPLSPRERSRDPRRGARMNAGKRLVALREGLRARLKTMIDAPGFASVSRGEQKRVWRCWGDVRGEPV